MLGIAIKLTQILISKKKIEYDAACAAIEEVQNWFNGQTITLNSIVTKPDCISGCEKYRGLNYNFVFNTISSITSSLYASTDMSLIGEYMLYYGSKPCYSFYLGLLIKYENNRYVVSILYGTGNYKCSATDYDEDQLDTTTTTKPSQITSLRFTPSIQDMQSILDEKLNNKGIRDLYTIRNELNGVNS